jgi:hypothetical protein
MAEKHLDLMMIDEVFSRTTFRKISPARTFRQPLLFRFQMAPTPVHRRFIRRSQHVHGRPNPDYRGERGEYVYRDAGEREECSGRRYQTFGFDFGFDDEFFFFVVFVFPVGSSFRRRRQR